MVRNKVTKLQTRRTKKPTLHRLFPNEVKSQNLPGDIVVKGCWVFRIEFHLETKSHWRTCKKNIILTMQWIGAKFTVAYYWRWKHLLSPMHSGKLNSTNSNELGRSVQFSFPLCIELATTAGGYRRFVTVKNLRRPSPVVAARRRFNLLLLVCVSWTITCQTRNSVFIRRV